MDTAKEQPERSSDYPQISPEIIEVIFSELQTNKMFYQQVLDLMNKLDLELPSSHKLKNRWRNRGTQTTNNELEQQLSLKRKITDELFKVKAKKMLNSSRGKLPEKSIQSSKEQNIFESQLLQEKKIAVSIGTFQLPEEVPSSNTEPSEPDRPKTPPPEDLKSNQIPFKQLVDIPVFKNYQKGERNQKLYIKNLSKDVTEEDLLSIYKRFTDDANSELEVKLMQHGKMKGQAFVTFKTCTEKELHRVEEALNSTLGLILRKKPMVVCYAKKQ